MNILALDLGSSSVKAAILSNNRITGPIARAPFPTRLSGVRVEVDAKSVLSALARAIADLGQSAKRADLIALTVMAPSWCAIDKRGNALTPLITHQDRRSVEFAREIERRIGKARHLRLAGNRPFPGGISSTTFAWHLKHEPALMKRADLVGHLSTLLHRVMTGARVIDPSNASFTGLYNTLKLSGWNDDLLAAAGAKKNLLPDILPANQIAGRITPSAARRFHLTAGTPMLAGCMDGSCPILLAGNHPGTLVDVCGSTDVLALCTDDPRPHENLLTRAVGVGRRWLSVSTLAAAGSALDWTHKTLFSDLPPKQFHTLIARLAKSKKRAEAASARDLKNQNSKILFDNQLAGSRTSLEQTRASFTGLTLSTTREDLLAAVIDSLVRESTQRLSLIRKINPIPIRQPILLTGGAQKGLAKILHHHWPENWKYKSEEEATLRGAAMLADHRP